MTALASTSGSVGVHAEQSAQARVTVLRVLRSEWTKFRSLRSTIWTMLAAATLMVGLGALLAAIAADTAGDLQPGSTVMSISLTGTFFAQLAVGVLGALTITAEYSTGMIRASLTVIPTRLPLLWAKLAVVAAAVFVTMLIAGLAAFLIGMHIFSSRDLDLPLTDPVAARSVLGAALYLTVAAMTGVAFGALLRNTATAITTFVALFFVIPPLTSLLPAAWTDHFVQYLPSNAGTGLISGTFGLAHPLGPWTGFAVMCAFLAVLVALAALRLHREDV